jgi:hypothetical protein
MSFEPLPIDLWPCDYCPPGPCEGRRGSVLCIGRSLTLETETAHSHLHTRSYKFSTLWSTWKPAFALVLVYETRAWHAPHHIIITEIVMLVITHAPGLHEAPCPLRHKNSARHHITTDVRRAPSRVAGREAPHAGHTCRDACHLARRPYGAAGGLFFTASTVRCRARSICASSALSELRTSSSSSVVRTSGRLGATVLSGGSAAGARATPQRGAGCCSSALKVLEGLSSSSVERTGVRCFRASVLSGGSAAGTTVGAPPQSGAGSAPFSSSSSLARKSPGAARTW